MSKIPYAKRKDGRYYKQIVVGYGSDGKRIVKTLYDRNWQVLHKKVRDFEIMLGKGQYVERDITFGECVKLWMNSKIGLSPGTINSYKTVIKKLEPISYLKIKEIKPYHIQSLYKSFYDEGTMSWLVIVPPKLKEIFKFAIDNNLAAENVACKVQVPKVRLNKKEALTKKEKEAVMQAADLFNKVEKAFVFIALFTGMRRGEILSLNKSDIDFGANTISVNKTLVTVEKGRSAVKDSPKSKAGVRKIPMPTTLREYLEEYISGLKSDDLFKTKNNTFFSVGDFSKRWERIVKKIDKFIPKDEHPRITPHRLRHNYATDLIYAGVPVKTVQYLMGHENASTSMNIYASSRVDMSDTVSRLDDYIAETLYVKSMSETKD